MGQQDKAFVMVVDDERIVAELVSAVLEESGYSSQVFLNGRDAIQFYEQNQDSVDLILLDILMPGMNGDKVFAELKQLNPDVKVMILTGYAENIHVAHMLSTGARGIIHKPFSVEELCTKVKELVVA
jgi:CheY-like chemotaxis protein